MKYILFIFLLFPGALNAQRPSNTTYWTDGEYYAGIFNNADKQIYSILSVVPTKCPGQAATMASAWGGPHDLGGLGTSGEVYYTGSVFSTAFNTMVHITVDSAGNALPPAVGMCNTGTSSGAIFTDIIWTDDSTTGRQVGLAGSLIDGVRGNGTSGATNQTSFVWAVFPNGTHIKKVCGLDGVVALDSKGSVWTWGFANNKAKLMRGTSPTVVYSLPDTVPLPAGTRAIDICSVGQWTVILLNNGHVLGGGDHPKYWGGPSASTSNSPQDYTAYLTGVFQSSPLPNFSSVAKVRCNNGAVFYILTDSTLWGSGDDIVGTVGDGKIFNMLNYAVSPPPSGSFSQPYAYDNGQGEFPSYTPTQICPGTHNWVDGFLGSSNSWATHFYNNKGEIWGWGRDKSGQLGDAQASCNFVLGGLNGTYPDMINKGYPELISPVFFGSATTFQCLYCVANPGATNCSQGTSCYNGALATPTVVCEAKRTLPSTTASVTLSDTRVYASGDHELTHTWTQVSGPPTIFPFHTIANPLIYLPNGIGTYIFQDSITGGNSWKTAVAFDTVILAANGIGPIPVGVKTNVVASLDSTWTHTILAPTVGFYVADTLALPPNSQGIFNLSYLAYDTVQHFTGRGTQTVSLKRVNATYGAPYISYQSVFDTDGLSTHQSSYSIVSINGLPVVQVSGYGPANPIRWHVSKKATISPL